MMTHDPFQNYQAQGGYAGGVTPFGIPYTAQQSPFANPGIGGYGIHPQALQALSLQGMGIPGQQQWGLNPLAAALQNPLLQSAILQNQLAQNPFQQNPFQQNPFVQNPLMQNPLLQQHALAYHGWPQQQSQFGYPLAPQTFIGAGGIGQPGSSPLWGGQPGSSPLWGGQSGAYGQAGSSPFQLHPLVQAALRQVTGYGISPLAGCF